MALNMAFFAILFFHEIKYRTDIVYLHHTGPILHIFTGEYNYIHIQFLVYQCMIISSSETLFYHKSHNHQTETPKSE